MVLAGRQQVFRVFCTTGEGAEAFVKIKADFDKDYLANGNLHGIRKQGLGLILKIRSKENSHCESK